MFQSRRKIAGVGPSAILVLLLAVWGCGGNSKSSSSNNNPGAPNPGGTTAGSSNPAPTGGGTGGSGGGASSAPNFIASLLSSADSSNHGQITLKASASGTVQLQGAAASTQYAVNFCKFPDGTANCFSVGSVTTDASGNVNGTFTFSKSGVWVGIFSLQPGDGSTSYGSSFPNPSTAAQYLNPLQRASTVTGGLPSFWGSAGADPLTSGSITVVGTKAQITLTGAAPNASYSVSFCANGAGSSCFAGLGTITTDASGNGTGTAETNGYNPPGVFALGNNNAVEFVTGIKAP
ncbi:MAG TPA: hypothetical protein VFP40_10760 [Terriglobales bacterium]|nr:hypothetical protein [Terriglobales bacterium]